MYSTAWALSPETLAVQVRRGACREREVGRAAGAGLAGTGGVPAGLTPSMDLRFRGEGSTNHLKCSHDDLSFPRKASEPTGAFECYQQTMPRNVQDHVDRHVKTLC